MTVSYLVSVLGCVFVGWLSVGTLGEPPDASALSEQQLRAADYELHLETPGEVAPGKPMAVEVHIHALNGKKVNVDYPARLQVVDGETWELVDGSGRLEPHGSPPQSATLVGTVKAKAAGVRDLSIRVSFSVCSKEQCLVQKVVLTDSVTIR